ncbi:MAG: S41 family peptidase [Alistipes sp.]|nr:S41 family peptidase [Alistipes sp.]
MQSRFSIGVWLTGVLLLAGSCAKGPAEEPTPSPYVDEDANRWIYSQMKAQYLYTDYTQTVTPYYDQACESFFQSLLSPRSSDNDGKHAGGKNYFYSYLERTGSKALVGDTRSYGFEYQQYYDSENHQIYTARVLFVVPDSPASRAGLKRGDWIRTIKGKPIYASDLSSLKQGGATTFEVERCRYITTESGEQQYVVTDAQTLSVEAAELLQISPLFYSTVFERGSHRIGYLVYNAFESGPGGLPNYEYHTQMKSMFAAFKQQGIDELVLDLRYNSGGYILTCQLLCSMLCPASALGQTFMIARYNEAQTARHGGDVVSPFLSKAEMQNYNLDLKRLYVLSGQWTASASEAVINTLRPYMSVRLIGTTTEGKNVGSTEITSSDYMLKLHPITQKAFNKNMESEYQNGFTPDIAADDLLNQDQMAALGDPDEFLLQYALGEISGSKSMAMQTKSTTQPESTWVPMPLSTPNLPQRSGLIEVQTEP